MKKILHQQKPLELINEFHKVMEYKVKKQQ